MTSKIFRSTSTRSFEDAHRGRVYDRWSARKSTDEEKEKTAIKELRQKESMAEAGQSTIDDASKSQF
jgi:hypothetical protein